MLACPDVEAVFTNDNTKEDVPLLPDCTMIGVVLTVGDSTVIVALVLDCIGSKSAPAFLVCND